MIMSELKERNLKFETLQLHVGQEQADPVTDARAVPIYASTSYVFHNSQHAADRFALKDAGNIYGRLTNPTQDVFEQRIAALEGGVAALAVASGAAAVTYTIQNLAGAGDHIVAAKTIYGGSYNLLEHTLPTYGIKTTFVDPDEEGAFENAIQDNTKAIYIESLGNPNSNIIDIEKVAAIAHAHKIPLVVDSTFATPYLLRPIEHGADIVVHSATKFIGGHGTAIGGVIVDSGKFDWEASGKFPSLVEPNPSYHGVSFTKAAGPAAFVTKIRAILLRDTGATISPFHAFIFLQGLETLSLRVERHVENALKVVDFLKNHPQVERVNHPSLPESGYKDLYDKYFPKGAGSIFTFEIKGTSEDAQKFIDNLKVFSLLANVADVKSLAIHPATTTHSQLNEEELAEQGIKPNTIRLSIGTEHIDDIIFDLEEAFKAVANK
ncbi:O-acetylhomoserine aminocarboxypropyltransferase/cysteine synthase [Clostridium sp. AM09-51]|nr:O-acetylhomoserine aminocarboxypropyltransferase/cysteine synthase [Clostridium sp. AM09-51]